MRLIDADVLIDALDRSAIYGWSHQEDAAARTWAKLTVELTPTVEPEPKWVPCSDRMPPDPAGCLVTATDGEFTTGFIARWIDGQWFDDNDNPYPGRVIAWMPFPWLYEEEDDEPN